jgi:hypothetical protein
LKPQIALAAVLIASPFAVMAQQTGVSTPPDAIVDNAPAQVAAPIAVTPAVRPAPVAVQAAPSDEAYGPYRPYNSGVTLHTHADPVDPDASVVTEVPRTPGVLPAGTQLRVSLNETIATDQTEPSTHFTGALTENVMNEGKVIFPAGSTVEGRVTEVRGGRRLHGSALIHLVPDSLVMPDGTRVPLKAEVIDTDQFNHTKIDAEGNIIHRDNAKQTLAAMSLATGGAAAAGGMIGGGVGALVGAGIGAGVSTVVWLKADRQARLPKDSVLVLSLSDALPVRSLVREPHMPEMSAVPADPAAAIPVAVNTAKPSAAIPYGAQQSFVPTR